MLIQRLKDGKLHQFKGKTTKDQDSGETIFIWGCGTRPPCALTLDEQDPPTLKPGQGKTFLLPQAHIVPIHRNKLVAVRYNAGKDNDYLIAFTSYLPNDFQGTPAFVTDHTHRIFCRVKRPWKESFAIEGFLLLRNHKGEQGIVNSLDKDKAPSHTIILPRIGEPPLLLTQKEFAQ